MRKLVVFTLSAATLGLGLLAAAPASAGASGTIHAQSHRATFSSSYAIKLATLPDRITKVGSAHFAAIFGATRVTGNGNHVIVYLTSLSKSAEKQLSSLGTPGQVSFKLTSHTREQLLSLQATVTDSVRRLSTKGVRLVSWFPGINGDGLEHIGVYQLTRSKTKLLDSLFGARNIVLQNANRFPVAADSGNRVYDSAPWNGGDNITSQGHGCTSGVGINYNGGQYMLTAAHCYEPGWYVYNEFAGVSRPNNFMGIETSRDVRYEGDDTALIGMSVSNQIWTGIIGSPHSTVVVGDTTNPNGDTVYNEGAYSGQVASVVQNNSVGCISVTGYTGLSGARVECNIIWAHSNGIANQDGDSGGPMVRSIAGQLYITGIVSALNTNSLVPCQYNSTKCSRDVYYTAADEILSTEYPGATVR